MKDIPGKMILPQDAIANDQISELLMENVRLSEYNAKLLETCYSMEKTMTFALLAINLFLLHAGKTIVVSKQELEDFARSTRHNEYNMESDQDAYGNLVFKLVSKARGT